MTTAENPNSRSKKYVTYSCIRPSAPVGTPAPETITASLSDGHQNGKPRREHSRTGVRQAGRHNTTELKTALELQNRAVCCFRDILCPSTRLQKHYFVKLYIITNILSLNINMWTS